MNHQEHSQGFEVDRDAKVEALRQMMHRAQEQWRLRIERELFATDPIHIAMLRSGAWPVTPWYRRAWWSVRRYLSTLWLALIGRELVEPED